MIPITRPAVVELQPLPAGTVVGSFVLRTMLTRDEFGICYLATASASGGEVLIDEYAPAGISLRDASGLLKPSAPEYGALWEEGLQAFLQESELLARPLHPALVRVVPLWQTTGTAFRMRLRVAGHTLTDACATMTEPPSEGWLRGLLAPLLDAIECLHQAGWVHANVCPGQILVRPEEGPMLLDTAAVHAAIGARLPGHPAWPEPGFRPPELSEPTGEHPPGPWSDLYSLAAVARFCMEAPRTSGVQWRVSGGQPSGFYTRDFLSAFDRALASDPRERPQTVAQFRQQLQATSPPVAARMPLDGANRRGFGLADFPPRTTALPDREPLASRSPPVEHQHDAPLPPAWFEPPNSDPSRAKHATRKSRARRWPAAVAGVLGVLVIAAVATFQLIDKPAQPIAGPPSATLPPEQSIERDPTAAGATSTTPLDPRLALPQTEVSQAPPVLSNQAVHDLARGRAAAEQHEREAPQTARPVDPSPSPRAAVVAPEGASDKPSAACAPRTNFALYRCMKAQCEQLRYYAHPQCVRLRQYDELPN